MAGDRPEQTPTGLGTFPESLVPTLGMPVSFLEGQKRFTLLTVWDHLETEPVRVIYTTGNTVDAIPLRDEFAGFANDRHDDGYHIPISQWVGVAPRHSISRFTVARQTIVNGVEIQLHTSPPGVVGENSVWVAIFSSTDANFTVARTLVGVLGYRHAHQISDDYWTLIYLVANDITLNTGTYYWLALCASDPRLAPVDEWDGTYVFARRYLEVGAGVTLVDNAGDPYPDAGSTYDSYANRATWFRLYERTYTIEDIPLADGALAPGIGESATARRVAGVHHDMEIIGPSSGWSGLRTSSATASGGVVDHNWLGGLQGLGPDYYHLDVTQYTDLTAQMPFPSGAVLFANAANEIAHDVANLQYDDVTNQLLLGVGSAALPPCSFVGRTTDGMFSQAAGALGLATLGVERARLTSVGQLQLLAGVTGAAPTPMLHFADYYDNTPASPSISHINLYGGTYGFGVTSYYLNYISGRHHQFFHSGSLVDTSGIVISPYSNAIYGATDDVVALGTSALGFARQYFSDAHAAAPTTDGEVAYYNLYRSPMFQAAGIAQRMAGVLHMQTAIQAGDTIQDTAAETAFQSSSLPLPAHWWALAGVAPKGVHVRASGTFTTKVAPPGGESIALKFGAVTLLRWDQGELGGVATGLWVLDAVIQGRTAGAGGTVEAQGTLYLWNDIAGGSARVNITPATGGLRPVNTTLAANLEVTWDWDTAAVLNSATMRQCTMWAIN